MRTNLITAVAAGLAAAPFALRLLHPACAAGIAIAAALAVYALLALADRAAR